ncbi:hypothetical protein D3OALGA1CA_605 [Olavius algarvensis associated proteobacterium Delta 3]|nr:hypothetical protein D3OALGA1CA_605 [Olavius algarvensis associated proteobacterium Delta 3]CAB5103503.1 hypothetical protein D3OALGB2SA_1980 [Olavius algarvensis associated proteobacterium Delta 3]
MKKNGILLKLLIGITVWITAALFHVQLVGAVSVSPIDFATIEKGDLQETMTKKVKSLLPVNPYTGRPSTAFGELVSEVYKKDDIFTYAFRLTLDEGVLSEINTQFNVHGLVEYSTNGSIDYMAGYDYKQAGVALGGDGDGSEISITLDQSDPAFRTLDWNVEKSIHPMAGPLTFFFQSTWGYSAGGYNITYNNVSPFTDIAGGTSIKGFAPTVEPGPGPDPIPEPATLVLMSVGVMGGIGSRIFRRRRRDGSSPT